MLTALFTNDILLRSGSQKATIYVWNYFMDKLRQEAAKSSMNLQKKDLL